MQFEAFSPPGKEREREEAQGKRKLKTTKEWGKMLWSEKDNEGEYKSYKLNYF